MTLATGESIRDATAKKCEIAPPSITCRSLVWLLPQPSQQSTREIFSGDIAIKRLPREPSKERANDSTNFHILYWIAGICDDRHEKRAGEYADFSRTCRVNAEFSGRCERVETTPCPFPSGARQANKRHCACAPNVSEPVSIDTLSKLAVAREPVILTSYLGTGLRLSISVPAGSITSPLWAMLQT